MTQKVNRRRFNKILLTAGATALAPFNIARAQSAKLKIGVLLPKSGVQGLIGQSCQKGADLAPSVIKELLGIDIELMNADTETNVDTARTRAERLIQEGAHCCHLRYLQSATQFSDRRHGFPERPDLS